MSTCYLFTDTWPSGTGETFLHAELSYLSSRFAQVRVIPLHQVPGALRPFPANFSIEPALLPCSPKNKVGLLHAGLLNTASIRLPLYALWTEKVLFHPRRWWQWGTSTLVLRAALTNLHLQPKPDDLLYFYWGDKSVNLLPALKQRYPHLHAVVRFHGSDLYEEVHQGYIPFRCFVLPCIDKAAAISAHGQAYLLQHYPLPAERVLLARLGVEDRGINPTPPAGHTFHLVSCSNLVPIKQVPLLWEALQQLPFPIRWTHLGGGVGLPALHAATQQAHRGLTVELKGKQPNEAVLDFYRTEPIDLFVNVSQSEGVPVSIMEALSFGIPCLATAVGGTAEIVDEQVGGLLPAALSPEVLAKRITELYHTERKPLRTAARKRFEERCSAAKNHPAFYEQL